VYANFAGCPKGEVRRILFLGTSVNKDKRREIITLSSACASLKADMSAIRIVRRIMLVEDHAAFRQSLASLLGREPDLEVVAQAGSLAQARQMLDTPLDVAVLDLSLPDGDGRDLIGELRRRNAGISILVLTVMLGPGHLEEVLKAGADAVLHKVASPTTIVEEVRRLAGE
jgi:DNA-binding NarL/FixJ family response regulator